MVVGSIDEGERVGADVVWNWRICVRGLCCGAADSKAAGVRGGAAKPVIVFCGFYANECVLVPKVDNSVGFVWYVAGSNFGW